MRFLLRFSMTVLRRILSFLKGFRKGHIAKFICISLAVIAVAEFLLLNILVIYVYRFISSELSEISSPHKSVSFFDKLQNNKKFNNLIIDAKTNGVFLSLMQETLERLYIVHEHRNSDETDGKLLHDVSGKQMKEISFVGVDVSHSREATYIYNRILSRSEFPYHFLIVDIGTNDGFISSNSFNFIQWGWDAVLVEPMPSEMRTAQNNVKSYVDRYSDGIQRVKYVQAAIGDKDGTVEFVITKDTQGAESHVKREGQVNKDGDAVVQMPMITVKTLTARNKIPKNFGILSIDAEGLGAEILKQWITLGFRPAYIIFEHLHRQEPISVTTDYLQMNGYIYLGIRGWNYIFEHSPHLEAHHDDND